MYKEVHQFSWEAGEQKSVSDYIITSMRILCSSFRAS